MAAAVTSNRGRAGGVAISAALQPRNRIAPTPTGESYAARVAPGLLRLNPSNDTHSSPRNTTQSQKKTFLSHSRPRAAAKASNGREHRGWRAGGSSRSPRYPLIDAPASGARCAERNPAPLVSDARRTAVIACRVRADSLCRDAPSARTGPTRLNVRQAANNCVERRVIRDQWHPCDTIRTHYFSRSTKRTQ